MFSTFTSSKVFTTYAENCWVKRPVKRFDQTPSEAAAAQLLPLQLENDCGHVFRLLFGANQEESIPSYQRVPLRAFSVELSLQCRNNLASGF